MTEEEKRKMEEKERKKAEVRKRLEEASKAKKAGAAGAAKGKGFMTPERKKKLRTLLRKKAADELKKEQERKAEQRKKIIIERTGNPKMTEGANEATLQAVLKEYHKRLSDLEDKKYDLEYEVRQKDFLINELTIQVNDLRGKFVKPALKKVSKFDKIKLNVKNTEVDFRYGLKSVKKETFKLDDDTKPLEKPEWALGAKKEEVAEE